MNGYIPISEAAKRLYKTVGSVRYMCRGGKLRFKKLPGTSKAEDKYHVCVDDINQMDSLKSADYERISILAPKFSVIPQSLYYLINRGHVRWIKIRGQLHLHVGDCDEYYANGKRVKIRYRVL